MTGGRVETSISFGNMGWIRVIRDDLPGVLYLRLAENDGRWQVRELYIECGEGQQITARDLRTLPLTAIEAMALSYRQQLAARANTPGPDLGTLASNYGKSFGRKETHWVAESLRGQIRDEHGQVPNRRLRQKPPAARADAPAVPPLDRPDRIDDAFLRHVARAYADAISRGSRSPSVTLAREATVPARTVQRWIYLARKAGHLPPGSQGRIG